MNWFSKTSFVPSVENRVSPVDFRKMLKENVGLLLQTNMRLLVKLVMSASASLVG